MSEDPVTAGLESLGLAMADDLRLDVLDRVGLCDRYWVTEVSGLRLAVAFGDRGISLIRGLGKPGEFEAEYSRRFGRRGLRAAHDPPPGLLPALRSGEGGRVSVDLRRSSGFQSDVLGAAREIPAGETRSYAWIATRIGRPGAARAVGRALGTNPVPIVVPCHRVVRGDGDLGGYIFGLEMKEELLRREGVTLDTGRGRP